MTNVNLFIPQAAILKIVKKHLRADGAIYDRLWRAFLGDSLMRNLRTAFAEGNGPTKITHMKLLGTCMERISKEWDEAGQLPMQLSYHRESLRALDHDYVSVVGESGLLIIAEQTSLQSANLVTAFFREGTCHVRPDDRWKSLAQDCIIRYADAKDDGIYHPESSFLRVHRDTKYSDRHTYSGIEFSSRINWGFHQHEPRSSWLFSGDFPERT